MRQSFIKIFTAFIFFVFGNQSYSQFQTFSFERLTIEDGLSNSSINSILQTNDGFLWIATKDGLNRFDGQSFVVFKHDPAQVNSLPENYVFSLFESRDKTFWIGTWGGGLCRYDPVHESFIKVKTNFPDDNYVECINEDSEGSLWFGTLTGGLFKYNLKTKQAWNYNTSEKSAPRLLNNTITSLIINDDNSLWLASWGGGFSFFDAQKNIITHYTKKSNSNSLSHNNIWFIGKDKSGKILLSTDYGVDEFDPGTKLFVHNLNLGEEHQAFLNSPVRQTFRDSGDRLWIGTYEYRGLFMIEKKRNDESVVHHITRAEDDPQSLTMDRIRWIYEDHKKNIWIGTEDGLNKLPAVKPFVQFHFFPRRKVSLGGRVVSGIVEGGDSVLWISFGGAGFDKIDLQSNGIRHFKNIPGNPNSLNENDVTTIFADRYGKIWVGTTHSGLNLFDPVKRTFKHFIVDSKIPSSVDLNWIQQIIETKDGKLLVGTNAGLEEFDRHKGTLSIYNPEINGERIFPKQFSINALFEDRLGNLWIGTWLDGLFFYDKKNQKVAQYMPDVKNPNAISANKVTCITEDSHGFIWIGTHSGGINKFDKSSGKFYHYSTRHGLPNDVVFGIIEDDNGYLWISTLNGLAKFDPQREKFRNYDVSDGIIHNQFNWHASFKNKSGQMYFGGINGFISFSPDSVKINPVPPAVALTSFKVFGKEAALPQSLPATKEILLNYDQNFFSIEFTALDIAPSHKHQFAYFLDGIDPAWVASEQRTIAFYTDINPGKYKFNIKASNADGVWSQPLSLSIIVSPPWWMTWWFKIIIVLSLFTIGYLGYLYRLKQMLAIQNIRLNIANDLHDEIGSNLSSISVDSQLLLKSAGLGETEQQLTSFISKTAKETVETMRDIIWFINPQNDIDTDMVMKMRETAAKLLAGINWSFEVPSGAKLEKFNLEVRRNIFLIYKEVLNNIVRHAKTQNCYIELRGADDSVSLTIEDDGIGFDKNAVQENTGMRSIKRRAEKINTRIDISSEVGKGTTIKLTIPFGK